MNNISGYMGSNCVIISGEGGGSDVTSDIDLLAKKLDNSEPSSVSEAAAISNIDTISDSISTKVEALALLIDTNIVVGDSIYDDILANISATTSLVGDFLDIRVNYFDGVSAGITTIEEAASLIGGGIGSFMTSVDDRLSDIFSVSLNSNASSISSFLETTSNFDDFATFKRHVDATALEADRAAADYTDKFALVLDAPDSAPQTYKSNGTAWSPVISEPDVSVWTGTDIDDALTNAGASLETGDLLLIGTEVYYAVVSSANIGTHVVPMCLPSSAASDGDSSTTLPNTPIIHGAFSGVDPVAAAISGWSKTNIGTPTYGVTSRVLTLSAPTSADRGLITFTPGLMPSGPILVIITKLRGVCNNTISAQGPNISVRSSDGNRYIAIRPKSGAATNPASPWEINTTTTDPDLSGSELQTEIDRLEIYFNPAENPSALRYRIGGPGNIWVAVDESLDTFATDVSIMLDSGRNANTQSLSLESMAVFTF